MKQVQITVPYDKTEPVFDFLTDTLHVKNIMKFNTDNAIIFQFRIKDDFINETIEGLKSRGVGVEYGFVDIIDLKASLPREMEEKVNDAKIQREATLAVEEIYDSVKKQASLSFDYIAFVILAALMAGIGLIQNNVTVIVASMLLSPLMGPMLGVALGYVVRDRALFVKGTRNELIGIALSLSVGAVLGIVLLIFFPGIVTLVQADFQSGVITEITRRGGFAALDIGVAIFSGAAVAVSVTRGDMSTLVGVAISAALMPPAVNASMMAILGLATANMIVLNMGIGSFALLIMNILLIDLSAIVMFRVKKLSRMADKSATWTAVTQFKKSSESLYHTIPAEKNEEKIAVFTSAEVEKIDEKASNKTAEGKEEKDET
ncbi:TIGR00341 family protein [Candidatus Thorarchaeota archaeon]|nr:MAG: TIGR00341 family protein [Candidatus Thorarchaeota archaeon]